MDHDALALSCVIVSLALLIVATHPFWLFTFAVSGFYGGWRIGRRLIPAEKHGA